jgi:hypothetical protein
MKARILLAFTALLMAAATMTSAPIPAASAAPSKSVTAAERAKLASRRAPASTLSAKVESSWQTNNVVWALAVSKGVVYVGGQFTSVRPPGKRPGTGQVTRSYLAAFSARTGSLRSFHPSLDGKVTALAVSPDGRTLYVGGSFTHVGGAFRNHLAAFRTATGNLKGWAPNASAGVLSIARSPSGSAIYIGGDFTKLDGQTRSHAGAVSTSGTLLAWAPSLNGSVTSVAVARPGWRLLHSHQRSDAAGHRIDGPEHRRQRAVGRDDRAEQVRMRIKREGHRRPRHYRLHGRGGHRRRLLRR